VRVRHTACPLVGTHKLVWRAAGGPVDRNAGVDLRCLDPWWRLPTVNGWCSIGVMSIFATGLRAVLRRPVQRMGTILCVVLAGSVGLCACDSSGHAGPNRGANQSSSTASSALRAGSSTGGAASASRSPTAPIDHAATKRWVVAVSADAKALHGQVENLESDLNALSSGASNGLGYAEQLDQIALYNLGPEAALLTRHLQTRDGHVSSVDASLERDFIRAVMQWQKVATLAHAIKTTALKYNSDTKTGHAVDAFQAELTSTETLWNDTVFALWSSTGVESPPIVNPDCSPTDKTACN